MATDKIDVLLQQGIRTCCSTTSLHQILLQITMFYLENIDKDLLYKVVLCVEKQIGLQLSCGGHVQRVQSELP